MAAPHVAGWAALYLQANPSAPPAAVHAAAITYATTGRIIGLPANSYNRILFTWFQPYVTTKPLTAVPGSPSTLHAYPVARSVLGLPGTAVSGTGNVTPEWRDVS